MPHFGGQAVRRRVGAPSVQFSPAILSDFTPARTASPQILERRGPSLGLAPALIEFAGLTWGQWPSIFAGWIRLPPDSARSSTSDGAPAPPLSRRTARWLTTCFL